MSQRILLAMVSMLVSTMAFAQQQDEDLPRHDVSLALDAAVPVGSVKYFPGDDKTFYVGGTLQFIGASVNGQPVGDVPGIKTNDRWDNVLVGVGFRF